VACNGTAAFAARRPRETGAVRLIKIAAYLGARLEIIADNLAAFAMAYIDVRAPTKPLATARLKAFLG
jgi:hypothetical protein